MSNVKLKSLYRNPAQYPNTLLQLGPKSLKDGKLGPVISEIQNAGCEINALQSFDEYQLDELRRKLGEGDAQKVIKKHVLKGTSIFMEVSHPKGYEVLLENMLRIENIHGTGYSHFDRGGEKLTEKVFY